MGRGWGPGRAGRDTQHALGLTEPWLQDRDTGVQGCWERKLRSKGHRHKESPKCKIHRSARFLQIRAVSSTQGRTWNYTTREEQRLLLEDRLSSR